MKSNVNNRGFFIGGIFLVIAVLGVIIWLFFNNVKEERTSTEVNYGDISLLVCDYTDDEGAFFSSSRSLQHKHEVKIMSKDNIVSEMTYNYDAVYDSEQAAEDVDAKMHADYNKYMGQNNLDAEMLNPVFSPVKQKGKITLYLKVNALNPAIGKLFFLSPEEISSLKIKKNFNVEDFEKLYSSKGFSCEYER